jgi:pimeloyl-ACP methyl ester carboxylesterase
MVWKGGAALQPELLESVVPERGISALSWGERGAPLAILVHGFPDTAWTWRHLGPALAARGWRAVAPFTRGYAPSTTAPDGTYEIGALVSDIVALRAAFPDSSGAVLVGHDWGGAIVSAAASIAPESFTGATILAIPPLPAVLGALRQHPLRLIRQAPRSWYMALFQVPGLAERIGPALFALLWRLWASGYDSTADRRWLRDALPDRGRRRAAISYYRAVVNPVYRRSAYAGQLSKAFRPLRLPTLYLHGAEDTCGRVQLGVDAQAYMPTGSRRVVVPGAGHFLHLEDPATVDTLVCDWLHQFHPATVTEER